MHTVILLDGNQRAALSAIRSLGKKGLNVIVGDNVDRSLASMSRFCSDHFTYPDPRKDLSGFIDTMSILCTQHSGATLLPVTDITSQCIMAHANKFSPVHLPFPSQETILKLADKSSLCRLAEELSLPIPRTWYIEQPCQVATLIDQLEFPIIIKPSLSAITNQDQRLTTKVHKATSSAELESIIAQQPYLNHHPFMLQNCISGHGAGVFALYNNGKPITFFSHRRLREKPPSGGQSVYSESVELDPRMQAITEKLLSHVGWHGVAMVEFKITGDGTPYIIEVNARLWGSLQLAIDSGVDFPYLLYLLATNQPLPSNIRYHAGQRLRWLLGDLDHLLLVLRDHEQHYSIVEKIRTLARFMNFINPQTRYETFRFNDLRPFLFELKEYIKDILCSNKTH